MIYRINHSGFSEIEHTADVGIQVLGYSREELFANALFGMYHILYSDIPVKKIILFSIQLSETTLEDLLVSWLSEMNYHLTTNKFVAREIQKISITNQKGNFSLTAQLIGDAGKSYLDYLQTEIKAITYHQLHIAEEGGVYTARVIFDI
jgi:SHS2 domain-containing protein